MQRFLVFLGLAVVALVVLAGSWQALRPAEGEWAAVDVGRVTPAQAPRTVDPARPHLRVAVGAMVSPRDTYEIYSRLLAHIGSLAGADIEFVQRKTYAEVNEMLHRGELDLAFVCSGPYALGRDTYGFDLLASPEVQGSSQYRSYLITRNTSELHTLQDLRGRTFAFTDPDSNTGYLVPRYWLALLGETPESFFSRTIFTYSHDNSIMAVAKGLVDAAAVDSLIWEHFAKRQPELTLQTRIIQRSEPHAIPPVVASRQLSGALRNRLRDILLGMHKDGEGKAIISELMIDRFVQPDDAWYESIRTMREVVERQ